MKIVSLLFFQTATALFAVAGYAFGLPELAAVGFVLGALSVAAFVAAERPFLYHALFGLYGALTGVYALLHMPTWACAGALASALIGWDAAQTAPRVAAAPPESRIRFAVSYTLRSAALGALGVVLVLAAGWIRISLTFGTGLALSFAAFLLATWFLRGLSHREKNDDATSSDRRR